MRTLLVEDEIALADGIKRGLTAEGMVVDVANDGITGHWLGINNPYDVVILDILLPGKDGYKILEEMRAAQIWTPVIMLTAKDGEYDQTDAFDLGADDYLTKPFHFIVLVARLRALARRGAPERPVTLSAGAITIDPRSREASFSATGYQLELTAKQFDLLHYLARNYQGVVSKAEILDNVWGSDYEGSDKIVEVYMHNLRRKLKQAWKLSGATSILPQPEIETVRAVVYRLA